MSLKQNPNKMRQFFQLFLPLLLMTGCSSESSYNDAQNQASNSSAMLVFVDKTESVKSSNSIIQQNLETVKKGLTKLSVDEGDRFGVYFLHGNTLGARPYLRMTFEKIDLPDFGKGGFSQKIQERAYQDSISKRQDYIKSVLERGVKSKNDDSTNQETDLWASMEIISDFFEGLPPQSKRRVFFLSDMKEDVTGKERRYFSRKSPASKVEAEEWAQKDAQKMKSIYNLNESALSGVSITVLSPYNTTEESNFAEIRYYWQALFAEFGITDVDM